MASVSTRLGQLHVEVEGSGPPAVLWHSLFVDSTTWNRLRPALAAVRTLILIDGPGHGRTKAAPTTYTLDDCADAAREVLDRLAVTGPVDWLGNAWGGHVGVAFAAANPHACRSLVTIASPLNALPPADRRSVTLLYRLHGLLGPRPVAGILADVLLGKELRKTDPEAAAIVKASFTNADRAGMRQAIRRISLDRPDLTDRLPAITAPTLMVTGENDALCPPAETANWAARTPAGSHLVVNGAGHLAPLFDRKTAGVVTDFWARSALQTIG